MDVNREHSDALAENEATAVKAAKPFLEIDRGNKASGYIAAIATLNSAKHLAVLLEDIVFELRKRGPQPGNGR